MLRMFAILLGIAFIAFGVTGFLPQYQLNGLLFGHFQVSNIYNVIFIVCGILSIIAAMSVFSTRVFFQLIGIIFAVAAIVGFVQNGNLFIMHVNLDDNLLHIGIAVIALLLGFVFNR
jgi:hypothetical protein